MSTSRLRRIVGVVLGVASWSGAASCASARLQDPCSLLSASDATPYVGPLASPPYRASDGAADPRGDQCMYRGTDGREVTVAPDWSGRGAAGEPAAAGPWDRATWIPGGELIASKGTRSVVVDVTAASGKEGDALTIGKIIVPRFDHPLAYDGAKAAALVPNAHPHPPVACDLISRGEVEAAIGALAGAPTSGDPETTCTWRVSTSRGDREFTVEIIWEQGERSFAMLKHQLATVSALAGPWDDAALLHGSRLVAVRHDVFVGIDADSAEYQRARALMAAICARL